MVNIEIVLEIETEICIYVLRVFRQQGCYLIYLLLNCHSRWSLLVVKNPRQFRRCKIHGFSLWVGRFPWRKARQSAPVFFTGESHRQRSLVGYSP